MEKLEKRRPKRQKKEKFQVAETKVVWSIVKISIQRQINNLINSLKLKSIVFRELFETTTTLSRRKP